MSRIGSVERRRLLQGAVAGAAASILPLRAAGQSPAGASVLGATRHALVIGNNSYRAAPLKNPRNDARGIAEELTAADFSVSMVLDAPLAEMRARVDAFGRELLRTKGVGLFYFAGHGIQLSWRNYLLPVDTEIDRLEDVKEKALDLGRLLDTMKRAENAANIVILDACRNNPFGADFRVEQRGLSQVDAPVGTLLAYATAPGNVAIDGEGDNGLYTENLLREIRRSDAKVEDVFKRVRLSVRRRSQGQQIPWESTSLEEDFYFLPPEEVRKAGEAARQARLAAQREAARREEELLQQVALERESRLRAEAERQRLLEAELKAKKLAEAELQRKLKEAQDEKLRAEMELRRKEDAARLARQAEEERKRRAEAEAREAELRADAARRRKLEEERLAKEKDEAARKRQFEEETAAWEKLADSTDIAAVEAFLYRYPSSQYADLAQLRLDQLLARRGEKRVEIVNAPENPYTKGTARADTAFKVGDAYGYRLIDRNAGDEARTIRQVVTAITGSEIVFNEGRLILDLLGNLVQTPDGRRFTGGQDMALEYAIGKSWRSRSHFSNGPIEGYFEAEYRVVARETITVPAGTFDCFKVVGKGDGLAHSPKGPAQSHMATTYWVAPTRVRRPIARDILRRIFPLRGASRIAAWERMELTFYRQG